MENVVRATLTDAIPQDPAIIDIGYYLLGVGFLALAKLKFALTGYTPKPLSSAEIDRCIDYDAKIAGNYLQLLKEYGISIKGKDVLELGPGSDLGTGAYLLSKGARTYTAFDRHPNAGNASPEFYERMAARGIAFDGEHMRLKVSEGFDLTELERHSVDIVVSNAAFEHFDDPRRTLEQLSQVVRPGGVIAAVVDLQTHSRWIRDVDPNNIYRYSDWLYRLFYFPGQPNRVRSTDYVRFLSETGWKAAEIMPENSFQPRGRVHPRFRHYDDLSVLSFAVCARRM